MKDGRGAGPLGIALPIIATVAAMASFQFGAAAAKGLFPAIGPKAPPPCASAWAQPC